LILDTGSWILEAGYWKLDTGSWILDARYSELAKGLRFSLPAPSF
jgi:hypothetical protein